MRFTASLLACLPLLALVAGAPARGEDPPASSAQKAEPVQTTTVTLEDPGDGPRSVLRYAPEVGSLQTFVLSIASTMGYQMGELPIPETRMPTTISTITARVDEVKDGRIMATVRIDEAKVGDTEGIEPMIVTQVETTFSATAGKTAKIVVSDRGIGESLSFDASAKADPQAAMSLGSLESALNMFLTPLPEEPVGVGARWIAESKLVQQEISLTQRVTYTLKSMEKGVVEVEVSADGKAGEQDMAMPGAPPGTTVKLTSFELTGSGTTTTALSNIAPTNAEISFKAASNIDISRIDPKKPNDPPTTQHFKQTVTSKATVTPKVQE